MAVRIKGSKITDASVAAWARLLAKGDPKPLENLFERAAKAGAKALPEDIAALEKAVRDLFGTIATKFSDTIETDLEKLGHLHPGDGKAEFATAMGHAFEFGVSAHVIAVAAELFMPLKHLGIPTLAALAAEFSGFKELVAAYHGPLIENAVRIPSKADHAAKFRSTPPAGQIAAQWRARRLIADNAADNPIAWSGLMPEYQDAQKAAAYRPIQPRTLVNSLQNAPFPRDELQGVLENNSYRDADIQFMLDTLEFGSTRALRQSYAQEAMTAYGQGVISDDELNSAFDDVGWSNEAKALAFKRALLLRRISLARDAEATIVPEVRNGVLDDITGLSQLETAGVQPWKAQMQITKADAGALISLRKKQLSEAAKAETQRVRNLKNAAIAEFQRGVVDEAGLTAALLAIPVGPLEAASIVAVQNAIRSGKLKYLYGQLRTPQAAATLRIQVEAIGDQYKKELTTAATARQQLTALQVDAKDIQALLAKWGALRGKPSATAVFNPT